MAGLVIRLIGSPLIAKTDSQTKQPPGRKAWGLLAFLALERDGASRHRLAALLFPDAQDPLGALRWNLSQLRRAFGTDASLSGDPIRLILSPGGRCDVRGVVESREALEPGGKVPEGELLEGLSFADSPAFDAWLEAERNRIENCVQALLYERALAALAGGAAREAAELASRVVERDPFNTDCQVVLVKSLTSSGEHRRAREQVSRCSELFHRELGVGLPRAIRAALYGSAAPVTEDIPPTEAAVRSYLDAANASLSAGAVDRGLDQLRLASELSGRSTTHGLQAETLVALAGALIHQAGGRGAEVADLLHRAIAAGSPSDGSRIRAAAYRELGFLSVQRGIPDNAARWLDESMKAAGGLFEEQAKILGVRGMLESDTARYNLALKSLAESEALAAETGSRRQQAFSLAMIGRANLLQGNLQAAEEALDQSLDLTMSERWLAFHPFVEGLLGELYLAGHQPDRANPFFDRAWVLAEQGGDHCFQAMAASNQARLCMQRHDPDGAARWIRRGLGISPWYLWYTARLLDTATEIAIETGSPMAGEYADRLHALASGSGLRELTARAQSHRALLGDASAASALQWLAADIDSPALNAFLAGRGQL